MKKNLALILAIVMLLGSLFGVMSMAEATEDTTTPPAEETPVAKYTPEVAYSSISYTDKMYMSFAVPAPAALDEGAAVKLILWKAREAAGIFSYNDQNRIVLDAEAETVKIGDVDHLVFKYDALTSADMANVIYVRPAVVAGDKATAYGSVVEYSVLEYISAAKGEFEGIAGLEDPEYIGVLDSMLEFGALAQKYLLEDAPEFFVNDELRKIFVNPIVNGEAKGKVFAGFFKYEEGADITLVEPFYDNTEVYSVLDKDGAALPDADPDTPGFQIASVDADIEITLNYRYKAVRWMRAEEIGPDFDINNKDRVVTGGYPKVVTFTNSTKVSFGAQASLNLSGDALKADSAGRMNYYHGISTIADPEDPNGLVFFNTTTNAPSYSFLKTDAADFNGFGYNDTVEGAITFHMELGRANPTDVLTGGKLFIRNRSANAVVKDDPNTTENEAVAAVRHDIYAFYITNNQVRLPDNKTVICEVPETGLIKWAVTIFSDGTVYGYAENENGEMVKTAEGQITIPKAITDYAAIHEKYLNDDDPSNDEKFLPYANLSNWFSMNLLETHFNPCHNGGWQKAWETETVKIGDADVLVKDGDVYNPDAVAAVAKERCSMIFDNYEFIPGAIYEK